MGCDFIIFNGCSFTEGGGLSNPIILNLYGYNVNDENHHIKKQLSFANLIANHFNCDYINMSESGNSNQNIFQKVFEYVENNLQNLQNYKNIHCFIQTTMSNRMTVNYKNEILNLNTFEKNNYPYTRGIHYDDLQKWYESYIVNFYDEQYEAFKIKKEIYTIREYLKSKNINAHFIIYSDVHLLKILNESDYIKFNEHDELMMFIEKEKLRISDDVDNKDGHLSPNGHKKVAEILIKKIKND